MRLRMIEKSVCGVAFFRENCCRGDGNEQLKWFYRDDDYAEKVTHCFDVEKVIGSAFKVLKHNVENTVYKIITNAIKTD